VTPMSQGLLTFQSQTQQILTREEREAFEADRNGVENMNCLSPPALYPLIHDYCQYKLRGNGEVNAEKEKEPSRMDR
jgi:hypothetical protein